MYISSWSGGKDSCLAYYKAKREGYDISYLFNTISREFKRVRFHGIEGRLIQTQAKVMGIPILQVETTPDRYEQEFKEALRRLLPRGISGIVFGDIHLQHCLEWAEKICGELGLRLVEPLWGRNPEEILLEFIDSGFEAIIVSAQANLLGEEWIGRKLDMEFLKDLRAYKHIDLCGENGEYHTLVVDGPLFKKKIKILESRKVKIEGYWFLDIIDYGVE